MSNIGLYINEIKQELWDNFVSNKKHYYIGFFIFILGFLFGLIGKSAFSSFKKICLPILYEDSALTRFISHTTSRESFLAISLFFYLLFFIIIFLCNFHLYLTPFFYIFYFAISIKLGCDIIIYYLYLGIVSIPFLILFIIPCSFLCYLLLYTFGVICFKNIYEAHYYGDKQILIYYLRNYIKEAFLILLIIFLLTCISIYSTIIVI